MIRLKQESQSTDIAESAKRFEKIDGKQIMGHARTVPAGGAGINTYRLEDGSIVHETDDGTALTKANPVYQKRLVQKSE